MSDEQLVAMLVERARSEVLKLTGNLEGSPFMFAPRWDKASFSTRLPPVPPSSA
ncbi:hypothetical protein OG211_33520 [Streptomyces niveus]|uniref:hypothetical protein n=1 Tax=Streptomyces niveus TaxID=193462 RepID=UPI003869FC88|nr:hypothetical protein OG211_33520 [Streptomyces niveus]